jgi:two-component system response regulator CpxR
MMASAMDQPRSNDVLIIDDDAELCKLVARFLTDEGFAIESAQDGEQGIAAALSRKYEMIVLDVMMPGMNGFEVLRRIRAGSRTPILMLTAKGDVHDRILGLELGADDYLPKPFDPHELASRIRAILRRATAVPGRSLASRIGDISLDLGTRSVHRDGQAINLTTVEYDLLEFLLRAPGQVVGREELAQKVLGREFSPFDRSIDTHVCNLRKKLGTFVDGTERIKGVRGIGYFYAAPVK